MFWNLVKSGNQRPPLSRLSHCVRMAVTRRTAAAVGAQSPAQPIGSDAIKPQDAPSTVPSTYSVREIIQHDTANDLWVIVRDKVRCLPANVAPQGL